MTSPEQSSSIAVASEQNHNRRIALIAVAAASTVGAVAIFGTGNNPFRDEASAQSGDRTVEQMCDDYTDAGVTKYASFDKNAVMEKFQISTKQEAKKVIDGSFNENGPLAGKGDFISGATIQAFVADRATDKSGAVDPNYDYVAKFGEKIAQYSADNGVTEARKDCKENYEVLSKTGQYTTDWAKGEPIVAVNYVRNGDYGITGVSLTNYVAKDKMEGVEFAYREGAKGVNNSFASALLEESTGMIYLKGVRIQAGKTATKVEGLAGTNKNQDGTNKTDSNGGSSSKSETNTTEGTNGTSGSNGGTSETGSNGGSKPTGTNGGTNTGEQGCGVAGKPECGGGSGTDTGNEGPTGTGTGPAPGPGTGGGEQPAPGPGTGGGEEPAPAPRESEAPAPQPQPSQEPAPQPQPSQEPAPQPSQSPQPQPSQSPADKPAPKEDCNEHNPC